jgi:hypothetical protein
MAERVGFEPTCQATVRPRSLGHRNCRKRSSPPSALRTLTPAQVAYGLPRVAAICHVLQTCSSESLNIFSYFDRLKRLLICGFSVRFRGGSYPPHSITCDERVSRAENNLRVVRRSQICGLGFRTTRRPYLQSTSRQAATHRSNSPWQPDATQAQPQLFRSAVPDPASCHLRRSAR